MTPVVTLLGLFAAIIALAFFQRRHRRGHESFIDEYAFPAGIRQKVHKRYPHLTEATEARAIARLTSAPAAAAVAAGAAAAMDAAAMEAGTAAEGATEARCERVDVPCAASARTSHALRPRGAGNTRVTTRDCALPAQGQSSLLSGCAETTC